MHNDEVCDKDAALVEGRVGPSEKKSTGTESTLLDDDDAFGFVVAFNAAGPCDGCTGFEAGVCDADKDAEVGA